MKVESYVGAARRMMKVFTSKAIGDEMEISTFRLICSDECAPHAEDLWGFFKDKYAVLIGGGKTVEDKLLTSNVTNLGALNTTHPPASSFIEQIWRGSLFLKTNQEAWSKRPRREVNQQPSNDDITAMYDMIADMKSELANCGYALRRHNARHADSRENQIIIQDVVREWIEFKHDLPIERAAAVTHLQPTVMLATILSAWERAPWVIPALPTGIIEVLSVNKDYADSNVRTRHWRNLEDTTFVLSVVQGPAAAASSITPWSQHRIEE